MNNGLNLLRFFLACNVVLFHLWNSAAPGAGPVAVMGFFFISGFLITHIVQQVYTLPGHSLAYLCNRALRIYPQYAAALAIGLLAIHTWPAVAFHINTYLRWPATAAEWIPQLAIMGLDHANVRVLPATWTLGTELYFYIVIAFMSARSKRASIALFLVSVPVGVLCAMGVLPFAFYGNPIGNAFVFAFGSVMYFYRDAIRVRPALFLLACAAYLANEYLVPALEQSDVDSLNLACSVLPLCLVVLFLVQNDPQGRWMRAVSGVLGKIAYPIFLLHWAVCIMVSALFFGGLASTDMPGWRDSAEYFITVFATVVACSLAFYLLIDQPVERFRQIVRGRASGFRGTAERVVR